MWKCSIKQAYIQELEIISSSSDAKRKSVGEILFLLHDIHISRDL